MSAPPKRVEAIDKEVLTWLGIIAAALFLSGVLLGALLL